MKGHEGCRGKGCVIQDKLGYAKVTITKYHWLIYNLFLTYATCPTWISGKLCFILSLRALGDGDSAILYIYHLEHTISVVTMPEDGRERAVYLPVKCTRHREREFSLDFRKFPDMLFYSVPHSCALSSLSRDDSSLISIATVQYCLLQNFL